MLRGMNCAFALASLIFALVSHSAHSIAADAPPAQTSDQFSLPTPQPDAARLDSDFPTCDTAATIAQLRKCLVDLESYRSINLERYNQSVLDYGFKLKLLDKGIERKHARNALTDDAYEDDHDTIQYEFAKLAKGGAYLHEYVTHYQKYIDSVRDVDHRIAVCGLQIGACK